MLDSGLPYGMQPKYLKDKAILKVKQGVHSPNIRQTDAWQQINMLHLPIQASCNRLCRAKVDKITLFMEAGNFEHTKAYTPADAHIPSVVGTALVLLRAWQNECCHGQLPMPCARQRHWIKVHTLFIGLLCMPSMFAAFSLPDQL